MSELRYQVESDPSKAIQSLAKLVAKQEEVINKLKETSRAGRDTKVTFEDITGALGRYISVAAGLRFVSQAFQEQEQRATEAARRIDGMSDNLKRLIQISASTSESQSLQQLAKDIALSGGIGDENKALAFAIEATTSGFSQQETRTLARVGKFEADSIGFVKAMDAISDAFKNLPGGVEGTINTSLRLLQERTQANIVEVLQGAAANADVVGELGGSFAQAAALQTFAAGQRDPQQVSSQIRLFLSKLITDPQKRFLGGPDVFADIRASETLTDAEMDKLFGERERAGAALARGLLLRNLPRIEALSAEASAAALSPQSLLAQAEQRAKDDPRLRSIIRGTANEERAAQQREAAGMAEREQEEVIKEIKRRQDIVGMGPMMKKFQSEILSFFDVYLQASPETLARIGAGPIVSQRRGSFRSGIGDPNEAARQEAADILRTTQNPTELTTNNAVVAENNMLLKQQNDLLRGLQISGFVGSTRPSLNAGVE